MKQMRRFVLPGLCNARDLGGYATADGGVTRFGVFLRCEAPHALPKETIQALHSYGVRASADLRGADECARQPSDLQEDFQYYPCPLAGGAEAFEWVGEIDWGQVYLNRAEDNREWVRRVLELAAAQEGGFLFHCAAGKDRTGMIACYLLSIAGASREDIAADYCMSEVYLQPLFAAMREDVLRRGGTVDESLFRTPYTAMLAMQDGLCARYGSVLDYLRTTGLRDETMQTIREKFVAR